MARLSGGRKLTAMLFILQASFIILFGFFVDYGWDGTPVSQRSQFDTHRGLTTTDSSVRGRAEYRMPQNSIEDYYAMFQDVHCMIFVGFGFLMVFMHNYSFGAMGFNFLLASIVLQWAILMRGFINFPENNYRIRLDLPTLISADFSAGTVLISLGVVVGKLSPTQYVIMAILETVLSIINEWIAIGIYRAADAGGTITIHLFGAYFGLALARTIQRKQWSTNEVSSLQYGSKNNDLLAMVGTLFLWMFWPSFNAAIAVDDGRYRAIYNTYLAISASCIGAFMMNYWTHRGKFSMAIIQNSTLAGGVIVGSVADMYLHPWGSLICGFAGGIISSAGFDYVTPILNTKFGIHDSCGVHNLHAMPSFFGSFVSVIVAACATLDVYGSSYYAIFPATVPTADSTEYINLKVLYPDILPGVGRSSRGQAALQLAALTTTLGIAIAGGILTGSILRLKLWDPVRSDGVFDDSNDWLLPVKLTDDDEALVRYRIGSKDQFHQSVSVVTTMERRPDRYDDSIRSSDHYFDGTKTSILVY